jgi:hypothetical protein
MNKVNYAGKTQEVKTSFPPNLLNKTTSVAQMNINIHEPHYLIEPMKNEVMRSTRRDNPPSTKVVLLLKLGGNEVIPIYSHNKCKSIMKKVNIFLAILLLTSGCGGKRQGNATDDFITVDVTASYPKKELILQDFMDVEYIALETSNEFVCQGEIMAIGKEIIVVKNRVDDGDIFIFDRNGKGLRKINRFGRSGEDYTDISGIVLDEDNDEMFVIDNPASRIMVYDLYGKFKRTLRHKEGARYANVYNFNKENLICRDRSFEFNGDTPFVIISKQDGSIVNDIHIPYQQKKQTAIILQDDKSINVMPILHFSVIPYHDSWILTEPSSDTVYQYLPDHNMTPFMARTPTVQSMTPEVFLFPFILTERYYFMKTEKKEFDFSTGKGLPKTYLMYDRQEKKIFEYTVYNDNYYNKTTVDMAHKTINNEIAFSQKIEADDLVDAYEKGQLKGKLKEIAAGLKEEDNPVIMLVKYKK